ncbi:MAG TPA: SIMPL domain-containing protein, partial [Bradyrhizobium sp.]
MRYASIVAAVALALSAPALAQSDIPAAISVTGEASISVPPDLALVDAGVASDAKTAREA